MSREKALAENAELRRAIVIAREALLAIRIYRTGDSERQQNIAREALDRLEELVS